MTKTPPGIYLVNASGEMSALAVEDGSGDRALLREALVEHNVDFDDSYDYPDVRRYTKDLIDDHDDGEGAPLGDVVEAVAEEYAVGTAIDVVDDLHRTGEVYAPTPSTLRRVTMHATHE